MHQKQKKSATKQLVLQTQNYLNKIKGEWKVYKLDFRGGCGGGGRLKGLALLLLQFKLRNSVIKFSEPEVFERGEFDGSVARFIGFDSWGNSISFPKHLTTPFWNWSNNNFLLKVDYKSSYCWFLSKTCYEKILRHLTTKDFVVFAGSCMMSYIMAVEFLAFPEPSKQTKKSDDKKLFMWYWLIFCVWCSSVLQTTFGMNGKCIGRRKNKRQTLTQSNAGILFYLPFLVVVKASSCHLSQPSSLQPSIARIWLSFFLFYLWCYVTVSLRLLFVMFSECFIINDPERVSEQ